MLNIENSENWNHNFPEPKLTSSDAKPKYLCRICIRLKRYNIDYQNALKKRTLLDQLNSIVSIGNTLLN